MMLPWIVSPLARAEAAALLPAGCTIAGLIRAFGPRFSECLRWWRASPRYFLPGRVVELVENVP